MALVNFCVQFSPWRFKMARAAIWVLSPFAQWIDTGSLSERLAAFVVRGVKFSTKAVKRGAV